MAMCIAIIFPSCPFHVFVSAFHLIFHVTCSGSAPCFVQHDSWRPRTQKPVLPSAAVSCCFNCFMRRSISPEKSMTHMALWFGRILLALRLHRLAGCHSGCAEWNRAQSAWLIVFFFCSGSYQFLVLFWSPHAFHLLLWALSTFLLLCVSKLFHSPFTLICHVSILVCHDPVNLFLNSATTCISGDTAKLRYSSLSHQDAFGVARNILLEPQSLPVSMCFLTLILVGSDVRVWTCINRYNDHWSWTQHYWFSTSFCIPDPSLGLGLCTGRLLLPGGGAVEMELAARLWLNSGDTYLALRY